MRATAGRASRAHCKWAAAGLALIAVCSSDARAEAPAPGLEWVRLSGAEACISATALAQRIEARVGRSLFASASTAALFVDGYVSAPGPGRWHVELAAEGTDGRILGRRAFDFEGADCSVIDEALTLVIAVTLYPNSKLAGTGIPLDEGTASHLDALFGAEPTDPDPATLPSHVPAPEATTAAPVASEPAAASTEPEPARASTGIGVDLVGASGLGQLPGVAFGAGVRVVLAIAPLWPIELGFTAFAPTTQEAGMHSAGSAQFDALYGSLTTCPWQGNSVSSLSLCAGTEIGRLHVDPHHFEGQSAASSDVIANLTGGAVLRARISESLRVRLALTGLLPLWQRSYTVQATDGTSVRLFRMSQIAGRAEIGMGLAF